MKLAWWRSELEKEHGEGDSQPPDPLIASLAVHFGDRTDVPIGLIDGWENLVGERPWTDKESSDFIISRGDTFASLALLSSRPDAMLAASKHGRCWAMADLALMQADTVSAELSPLPPLPSDLRALAVIGGLSYRALKRGGKPLFGDRFSPLAALRLGIFGS